MYDELMKGCDGGGGELARVKWSESGVQGIKAPLVGLGDKVPQKLKQFADTVYTL